MLLACGYGIFCLPLHPQTSDGAIAQLVEQRTENPCVPGSIPGGTTQHGRSYSAEWLLLLFSPYLSRQSKALGLSINWPCVPGSIPGGTTQHRRSYSAEWLLLLFSPYLSRQSKALGLSINWPYVPGSIPGGTTQYRRSYSAEWLLLLFSPYLSQCPALPIAAHCIGHRSVLRSSMQRTAYFHGLCSLGDACSPASCHQAAKKGNASMVGGDFCCAGVPVPIFFVNFAGTLKPICQLPAWLHIIYI